VQIRPANGARVHPQSDLTFFGLGDGHVGSPQRLSGSLQDHRSHEFILLSVPANFLILPGPTPRIAHFRGSGAA
jgi:hypothetical protein